MSSLLIIRTTLTIPTNTPIPKTIIKGSEAKLKCKMSFTPVIIVENSQIINSKLEPEIPGKTIAEIAIIPAIKAYTPKPKEN